MFCYQCEQTAKGTGCDKMGVCGKQSDVSDLQDLLVYAVTGLCQVALATKAQGKTVPMEVGRFTCKALFSTLTNVNFDAADFLPLITETAATRDALAATINMHFLHGPATFVFATTLPELAKQAQGHGLKDIPATNDDIRSLKHTLIFGIKGVAAYADHAAILGQEDPAVYEFIYRGMSATYANNRTLEDWVNLVLECGTINLRTMELLDAANTGAYGHPVPTVVPLGAKAGKAILVSGHDLKDLKMLLEQTAGKGIFVYTHGEMLPAHGYPELKKYPHFYGHYGTAWQNQVKEFAAFPGAILMTTNCIQKPAESYHDNIFTTGLVGWPGVVHVKNGEFAPVIEKSLAMPGFPADTDKDTVMTGFAHNAVLGVAGKVIEAVKAGQIKHFFLVAGCDGAKPGRNYYTEFVEKAPADTIVLTLACGKFRFFDKKLGDIGGIPRLLDMGQCNDAYSAIQVAVALAKAFDCGVNDLPLSLIISWYEQKAVAILLTLLALGIKNIRLGPSLPAFLTPNVLNYLVANYDIKPITTPDEDLKAILG